jgi:DNA-binding HxlR family transcriptional regulator
MRKENSSNRANQRIMNAICGTAHSIDIISGRWKTTIVQMLHRKVMRYTDMKDKIPGISDRMLSKQLAELERDGLIQRTIHAAVPPKVDYDLTQAGKEMSEALQPLSMWGRKYKALGTL